MAGEDNAEFDPRFDRAFQRGFDGDVTTRSPQPTAYLPTNPVRSTAVPTAPASPFAPAEAASVSPGGMDQPGFVTGPATPAAGSASPAVSAEGVADATAAEPAVEYVGGRNPFLIGLTVVSVVFVVGGLGGLQWLRGRFLSPDIATELDFVTVQAATIGAVIVIGLGLATAIGVLFLNAARWRGRRPSAP